MQSNRYFNIIKKQFELVKLEETIKKYKKLKDFNIKIGILIYFNKNTNLYDLNHIKMEICNHTYHYLLDCFTNIEENSITFVADHYQQYFKHLYNVLKKS